MGTWNSPADVPVGEKQTGFLFHPTKQYDMVEVGDTKAETYLLVSAITGMTDEQRGWQIRRVDNPGGMIHATILSVDEGIPYMQVIPGSAEQGFPIAVPTAYTYNEAIKTAQEWLYKKYKA